MLTARAYDQHVDQLFEVLHNVTSALKRSGIPHRVIGGMAVFIHVQERDPMAARSTKDIDMAIYRRDLARVAEAVKPAGFEYRHAAGVDMLVNVVTRSARSAIHLIMAGEKVRPEYAEPVPEFSPNAETVEGILLAPVADLVRMKLTSYRLKDKVHIQDLDGVGLITPEIEAGLSPELRERLAAVRAER
jgi:hypothetical protein